MRSNVNLYDEAFRRLRLSQNEVWELDPFRLSNIFNENGETFAAYWPMCVSCRLGVILSRPELLKQPVEPREFCACFLRQASEQDAGTGVVATPVRPSEIHTRNSAIAEELRSRLEGSGTKIVRKPVLDSWDEAATGLGEVLGGPAPCGILEDRDVSAGDMKEFCETAAVFYRARPWKHLVGEDVVELTSVDRKRWPAFVSVLGAGGEVFGLSLCPSLAEYRRIFEGEGLTKGWSLYFDKKSMLPWMDQVAFNQHGWPVAFAKAYPWAVEIADSSYLQRPDQAMLRHIELVMSFFIECAPRIVKMQTGNCTFKLRDMEHQMSFKLYQL